MSLRDDLIAAKALIDTPEKWIKGNYSNAGGCYCAIGALAAAVGWSHARVETSDAAKALDAAIPADSPRPDVIEFNDHPDTTHADVMALFDRAIAAAEAS